MFISSEANKPILTKLSLIELLPLFSTQFHEPCFLLGLCGPLVTIMCKCQGQPETCMSVDSSVSREHVPPSWKVPGHILPCRSQLSFVILYYIVASNIYIS